MGYRISTLKNLPPDLGCYYFLVGDYRNSSMVNDLFRDGFRIIADRLGENNAIIESTDRGLEKYNWELATALSRNIHQRTKSDELSSIILYFESRIPGLLIMWRHPSRLSIEDSFIHIPFQVLENVYTNSTELLTDLVSYAKGENINLITRIKSQHRFIKGFSVSLNMGIFAFNIDL